MDKPSEAAHQSTAGQGGGCLPASASLPAVGHTVGGNDQSKTHNIKSDNNETMVDDDLFLRARELINEAVELITMEEKSPYLKAIEKCPFLFEHNAESDPLKFMRRCGHNHWAAAKRLCLYWKERIFLFGEERAFLPMTLTGKGALNQQDILFVESGSPALLPGRTRQGQPILYFDRRQWPPVKKAGYERVRSLFYMVTVATENYEQAQTTGVCNIYLMNTPRMIDHEHGIMPIIARSIQILQNAMPVKFCGHFLHFPPKSRHLYAVQEIVTSFINLCMQNGIDLGDIELLFEREKGDIYKHLTEELGMIKAGIPTIAGGTWTFVNAQQWCKDRLKLELKTHPPRPEQISNECGEHTDKTQTRKRRGRPPKTAKPGDDDETKLFKKRAANAVSSRLKRQRRQNEEKLLREEHTRLTQEQICLKQEHARLVSLLESAEHLVEHLPPVPPEFEHLQDSLRMPHPDNEDYDFSMSISNGWSDPQPRQSPVCPLPLDEMALDNPIRFDAPDDILDYLGI